MLICVIISDEFTATNIELLSLIFPNL